MKKGKQISDSLGDLMFHPVFGDEDIESIEHVTMLLIEYAWSNDKMGKGGKRLKAVMSKIWERWESIKKVSEKNY